MLKVNCEACGAPYDVDPRRIPASGLKMRCPGCGASFHVQAGGSPARDAGKGALDLDLPAPKAGPRAVSPGGGAARAAAPAAAARVAAASPGTKLGLSDLPAVKGRVAESLPENLADDLMDPSGPGDILRPGADFGLDLPAPKKPAAIGESAERKPVLAPDFAPSMPDLELDLPAPKGGAAKPAASAGEIDLPAPKPGGFVPKKPGAPTGAKPAPAPPTPAAFGAGSGLGPAPALDSFDLDLPAPKAQIGAKAPPGAPATVNAKPPAEPGPGKQAPLTPDFDLDLPAPKPQSAALPKPGAPAQAPAAAPIRPALAPDFDLDLPAPKGVGSPAAGKSPAGPAPKPAAAPGGGFDLDLPMPKLDLDLPAPKRAEVAPSEPKPAAVSTSASTPRRASFSKPSSEAELPAVKQGAGKLAPNLPKDSLAVDPSPMFAGQKAAGGLGDLDDVQVSFTGSPDVDLPAPSNLPAVKPRTAPKPNATMLGLGGGNKLAKDSLDLPRGFEPEPEPFDQGDLLPAPADLPVIKQPTPAQGAPAPLPDPLGELDLPAPGDLPARKQPPKAGTMLGLGTQAAEGGLKRGNTALGIGDLLDESLAGANAKTADDLGTGGGFDFELDLPPPSTARGPDASGPIVLERLSLPSAPAPAPGKNTFGATMALGVDDLEPPSDQGGRGMSFPGIGDDDPFHDLGRAPPSNNQTIDLDSMLEFGQAPAQRNPFDRAPGSGSFGELDFGLDNGPKTGGMPLVAPRPAPVSAAPGYDAKSIEAELLGGTEAQVESKPRKKRKAKKEGKALPAYVWPLALVLVISGVGVGLGMFTNHGYFGVYLLEQLLPAAGDPAQVAAAIQQAERVGKSDTFTDVRKSLSVLSDARNEAGLNRELLSRSLLNEALYQLRFGEDAQSAQRSVAILARVLERGEDAKGLTLARAADAARRGSLDEAANLLGQVPSDKDPLRDLVAGEIALLRKQPKQAETAFRAGLEHGAGARAQWGLARALIADNQLEQAENAASATLTDSPTHSAALIFLARRAFGRGESAQALALVRKAAGAEKVGDARARPSRKVRAEAWALAGQIEQQLDHPREAQAAYEAALAADPLRSDSLIGSGSMLMRLGRARDALSRFESALSARPAATPDMTGRVPLIEASVGAVQALLLLERPSEALPRISGLASQFPKDTSVALWHGHALEALEKWEDAEAAFKRSIEIAPTSFAGYVALSQLLFKRSRPEEGARVLADAAGKVEDSAQVRRMLGYSELTRNHLPEAIHHFEAALRFDPKDAGALLGLTTTQRKSGNLAAAEKALAKLEQVDPEFAGVTLERGQLLESRGDYSGAASAYKKALETRPHDTDLKLRLGAALVTAGRLDEAEAILPEVLKERPTSAEAEHFVGRLLLAKNETAQAVQHFERSIAFDALRGEYHLYLAWAYLDQGNLGAALTTIQKALDRDPNLGDARWILGRIQLRTGAVKDAVANFQQARKLTPGRIEALASMGDAYDQLRDLPAAIRAYQEAVRHAPEHGDWWFRLGSLHLDRGSRDEARVALAEAVLRGDRLIEKPSWLADAHRVYAEVLREGGRINEALENYKAFLELAPASHPDRGDVERIVRSAQR